MERKLSFIGLSLMLAALGLTGCTKEERNPGDQGAAGNLKRITITADGATMTRTSYQGNGIDNHAVHWCADDVVGVFAKAYSGAVVEGVEINWLIVADNSPFSIVDGSHDGGYARFTGNMNDPGIQYFTYYAYHPYQPDATVDGSTITVSIPSEQTPDGTASYDCKADFLLAEPVYTYRTYVGLMDGGPLNFMFRRPLAIAKLSFSNIPAKVAGETVEAVYFVAPDEDGISIAGDMIPFDFTTGSQTTGTSATTNAIMLDYSGQNITLDSSFTAWFTMLPVTLREFTIVIATANYTITKTVEANRDVEFKANAVNRASVTLVDETTVTITPKISYRRVAAAAEIVSGEKYLIVGYRSDTHIRALDKTIENNRPIEAANTDISAYYNAGSDVIASNEATDAYAYTITATESGTYNLKASSGAVLGYNGTGTGLSANSNKEWKIEASGSYPITIANTASVTRALLYCYSTSNDRFALYETGYYTHSDYAIPRIYIQTVYIPRLARPALVCSEYVTDKLTVTWGAVEGAAGYKVSFNGGGWETQSGTSYEASGLSANTGYTVAVIAVGDGNPYEDSLQATITVRTASDSVYLSESFDDCNGNQAPTTGTVFNNSMYSGVMSGRFAGEGWIAGAWYKGLGCTRVGSGTTGTRHVTTPALSSIGSNPVDITLTFKAYSWTTGNNTLAITASDAGTVTGGSIALPAGVTNGAVIAAGIESTSYSVNIANAAYTTKITFTGAERFFLDDIEIKKTE